MKRIYLLILITKDVDGDIVILFEFDDVSHSHRKRNICEVQLVAILIVFSNSLGIFHGWMKCRQNRPHETSVVVVLNVHNGFLVR